MRLLTRNARRTQRDMLSRRRTGAALGIVARLALLLVLLLAACTNGDDVRTTTSPTAASAGTSATSALPPATAAPGTTAGTTPPGTEATTVPPAPSTTPPTVATTPAPAPRPTAPRPTPAPTTAPTVPTTNAPVPPLPPGANSVFVEGDSVLLGTTTTLPAALVGWNVTMDVVGSRRLTQAIPVLQARRAEIGRVLVIQMGNNYIPGEGGSFASQIDQAMAVVAGVERVVWITVAEVNGATRVAINNDIRAAATRHPNIVVAEWAPLVAAHPEYAPGDALHLTADGRIAMADLVDAAVGPAP